MLETTLAIQYFCRIIDNKIVFCPLHKEAETVLAVCDYLRNFLMGLKVAEQKDQNMIREVFLPYVDSAIAVKITDFRFHNLRHTFASHLVMAGVDLVTVKELLGHKTSAMTNRYTHLAQEHKAQAVAKLSERMRGERTVTEAQTGVVSEELKQAINAVSPPKLEQNRNIFLVRRGRGLGIANEIKKKMEAASGFEPLHRGFADLSLNHLGTPP
jgi:hypothetical protein